MNKLHFQSSLTFREKCSRKPRVPIFSPYILQSVSLDINSLHYYGPFVTNDEPILMHYLPKPLVYVGVYFLCFSIL